MLEYCSPVWSPVTVTVTLINQVESVQRRFTKRLPGFQELPHDERYALLGLAQPELRRLCADLILCYKIGFVVIRHFFHVYLQFKNMWSFTEIVLPDSRVRPNCRHFFAVRVL